jgi:flagellar basal-body rod protein FlgG
MGSGALAITEASMVNGMKNLEIIGHNLANADTAGFKREVAVMRPFSSYLQPGGETNFNRNNSGITSVTDFAIGVPRSTGNPLNVFIEGDGFFVLESPQGTVYTRQGSFNLNASGHLVDSNGYQVMGENGSIRLTTAEPSIDKEGAIWESGEMVGQLKIAGFNNPQALEKLGSGYYRVGSAGLQPEYLLSPGLRQGFIETSNVNGMNEMVNLIATMRQLEGGQKVVQGYNEMLDLAVQTIADI